MDELPIWFSMPAGRCGRLDVSIDRLWNTLQVDDEDINDIYISNCFALIDTHPIHRFAEGFVQML